MKKILCMTALSLFVSSAFAAETAVLKVTGTLTNSACTPELDNGGVIDYGTIRLGGLSTTKDNQLGHKSITLTINCATPTRVGWSSVDNRSSTTANVTITNAFNTGTSTTGGNSWTFGVGKTAGNVKIGAYSGFVDGYSIVADGVSYALIFKQDDRGTWGGCYDCYLQNTIRTWSVAAKGTSEPKAFTTATFPITTALAIEETSTLAISDDTQLDGQLTISLKYL